MTKQIVHDNKKLRELLKPYEVKNNALALRLFLIDYAMFFIAEYGVIQLPTIFKLLASVVVLFVIARLFIIGHDACHSAFTDSQKLNKLLGTLAFLPPLTTFQSWAFGHNVMHHRSTNLSQRDWWRPLSPNEYNLLSSSQKSRHRFYRSFLGVFFYYTIEVWWKYIYFPSEKTIGKDSAKRFLPDSILVTVFLITWLSVLYWSAVITNQSFVMLLSFGFVIPFFGWNMVMSFLIYLHHTHPKILWFENSTDWNNSIPLITTSVHIKFPQVISTGLHHIMEHTAHHLNMKVPCYNLKAAQSKLEEIFLDKIVVQHFSWRWYLECTRVCKLYDFEKHEWVQFPK